MKKSVVAVGNFLNRNAKKISVMLAVCVLVFGTVVFGDEDANSAETLWQTLSGLIQTWVTRLGAVVIFVGGIMFALGWKSDDAEQKSRGISTIIAGAIVMAIAAMTGTFFA